MKRVIILKLILEFEKLDSVALFEQFYQKIKGTELSAEAKQIVTEIMMEEEIVA